MSWRTTKRRKGTGAGYTAASLPQPPERLGCATARIRADLGLYYATAGFTLLVMQTVKLTALAQR